MQIGLINLFPSRPYFQHLIYFRYVLEKAGHKTNTFFCEGGNMSCYYKKQHTGIPDVINCLQCKLRRNAAKDDGYAITNYNHSSQDNQNEDLPKSLYESFKVICINSFSTIHRIEELQDIHSFYSEIMLTNDINTLNIFYIAIKKWLKEANLQKVILFNGRMDLMAVVRLACEDEGIDYFCYEGTFFGKGLSLFENDSCLSLKHWKECALNYIDKPLKSSQSKAALKILQDRLNRDTDLEWRSYFDKKDLNLNQNLTSKALVLLSSTNEVSGSKDFKTKWNNYLDGIDKIIESIGINPIDIIVRGHPVWATKICGIGGESIEKIYSSWAKERGYKYILSSSKLDTQYLIKNTDNVIINYSSAFFEAAYYNKKIFLTHSGYYDFSGIALKVDHPQKLNLIESFVSNFDNDENKILRLRKLLRFTYIASHRLPAFLKDLYPCNKLSWNYSPNYNQIAEEIISMLNNGVYPFSDSSFNYKNSDEEIECINSIIYNNPDKRKLQESINEESKLEPITFFIKSKKAKLILKLEKMLGKGDYLGI